MAAKTGLGYGIASLASSSPDASTLREELDRMAKRKRRRIEVDGYEYDLRCDTYDSFGDEAFRLQLRRV